MELELAASGGGGDAEQMGAAPLWHITVAK